MTRPSRPLLARSSTAAADLTPHTNHTGPSPAPYPSIRLISATPSATGLSSEASTSFNRTLEDSWAAAAASTSQPSPLAPKSKPESSRKKLVPKKSKLSILGMGRGADKDKDRGKDLSDVIRRVGASGTQTNSVSVRGGFDIYVDPSEDPEFGELLVVKKKKSRAALDGMAWGALGEVTNVPKTTTTTTTMMTGTTDEMKGKMKENPGLLKVKGDEDKKWWSIGRGRKDSKEKAKENKMSVNAKPVEFIYKPEERAKTPEPFKHKQDSRGRFNSLDSGLLLGAGPSTKNASVRSANPPRAATPTMQQSDPEPERARSTTPGPYNPSYSRSATPTFGGLLAPPAPSGSEDKQGGSIAIRAIRSMRSLARMGSWSQLKSMPPPTAQEMAEEMRRAEEEVEKVKEGERRDKKRKEKEGSAKEKKPKKEKEEGGVEKKKSRKDKEKNKDEATEEAGKKKKKSVKKEKAQTVRISTSSFEVGHLSASPEAPKVVKKHSILGLGLPSSMRLPSMRGGSTASSILINGSLAPPNLAAAGASVPVNPNLAVPQSNRLSVESAIPQGRDRSASVASSNGSSLRPQSVGSSNRLSSGSSVSGSSVRWDEHGLETVREQRRKEREERRLSEDSAAPSMTGTMDKAERRTSRESRRSSEGRRRTPLSAIFPEVQHHQIGAAMLKDVTEEESRVVREMADEGEDQGEGGGGVDVDMRRWSSDSDSRSSFSFNTRSTSSSMRMGARRSSGYPILTIEEATSDGHGKPDDEELLQEEQEEAEEEEKVVEEGSVTPAATPVKKARARPLSEQLLGRSRPKAMHEDEEGVISILDAATHDLALLINNLDLQATPGTPNMTPLRPTPFGTIEKATPASAAGTPTESGSPKSKKSRKSVEVESPLRKTLRAQAPSIASLRPYAQSRGYTPKSSLSPTAITASSSGARTLRPKPSTVSNANAKLIGQPITPWATLLQTVSPVKAKGSPSSANGASPASSKTIPPASNFKPGHKRTMTPAPEPEPEPVFQALKPARSKAPLVIGSGTIRAAKSKLGLSVDTLPKDDASKELDSSLFSARTFGPKSSRSSKGSMTLDELSSPVGGTGSLTPVFKRIQDFETRSSLAPADYNGKQSARSRGSVASRTSSPGLGDSYNDAYSFPIAREARKVLGMSGTMGGSDVSCYDGPQPDAADPDSDVPEELRDILATRSNRASMVDVDDDDLDMTGTARLSAFGEIMVATRVSLPPSIPPPAVPDAPPKLELPIFRASLNDDAHQLDVDSDSPGSGSDEDTKKSFDFTGELQKLTQSGGSDRASFVEQLEMAFKTPAKVDLRSDFGTHLRVEVPAVPAVPLDFQMAVDASDSSASSEGFEALEGSRAQSRLVDVKQPSMMEMDVEKTRAEDTRTGDSTSKSNFDMFSASRIVDMKEPTLLHGGADSLRSDETQDIMIDQHEDSSSVELARSAASGGSDGELNRSFRFGGLPRNESSSSLFNANSQPLTLSDIIPTPAQALAISESSMALDDLEDDSVLKSIYAKLLANGNDQPAATIRPRVDSSSSARGSAEDKRVSIYKANSRPASGISFAGLESFDEVRRGFEFSGDRSFYPPPTRNNRRAPHRRDESVFSIASISSVGHVLNNGINDPFDYGLPSLRERPSSEDLSSVSISMSIDDTFAFMHNQPRRRVESDASSFYFRAPPPAAIAARGHRRRESNMSVTSQGPPVALYNRSFGHHRRNDSTASASSFTGSFAQHGNASGRVAAWGHRRDMSMDSVMSDFSGMNLGRPGLGDKMFNNPADNGPLTAIAASPQDDTSNLSQSHFANRNSYDSIIDEEPKSGEDSLFEHTEQRTSGSSDSVFGDEYSHSYRGGLLPPNQFRPLSILSISSEHSPMKEDDTMISMIGGGHVRRRSVGSIIEASPCVRVEKRKHSAIHEAAKAYKNVEQYESPNKARIVEKPSIASTSSFQFGGERMIKAQRGLLERQSLEDSCLVADGEDLSGYCVPVFTRPAPASRSRSSTCTSSSGGDTPPLSASDGSVSEGSQSSIDLAQLNVVLSNATHPVSSVARTRARARARGNGHRRRYSKAQMSRSSVYETIEEEVANNASPASVVSKNEDATTRPAVFIVDADTVSIHSKSEESVWDDERGIVALRKFYALRDEAENTVTESKRMWMDTPFSVFALQSFHPPQHPAGMQALLDHSVQSYGPLPSELRLQRVRSRTSSRPSPYPASRIAKATTSPDTVKISLSEEQYASTTAVLRQVPVNQNVLPMPSLDAFKPFSALTFDNDTKKSVEPKRENAFGLPPNARPRVASTARRSALGWAKRSTGKSSTDRKENAVGKENVVGNGIVMTPSDTLRINRPRPKGRTPGGRTPASQNRTVRV